MNNLFKPMALIFAIVAPNFLVANESTGPYISIGQNWFEYDNKRNVNNDNDLYFGAGYQFSDNIAFELKYSDLDIEYINTSALYRFNPRSESSLFWKAGLGRLSNNGSSATSVNIGGGFDAHLTSAVSVTFGLDTIYQSKGGFFDLSPYVGISYFFGGSKSKSVEMPAKVVKPLDTDRDGVFDSNDRCVDTPIGMQVDASGCEIDSDGDGVVDSKDSCKATPEGAKVDSQGCRVMLTKDVSIKLHVQFANNSNVVSDQYRAEINKVAEFMMQYPDTSVVIEGHTDSRGAASYNKTLSQKRADAVMAYLISEFNVSANRVSAVGMGETSPITTNDTEEGRAENRRVQAEIKTSVTSAQ